MSAQLDIIDAGHVHGAFQFGGFASLLAPLGKEGFMREYWETTPCLIKRNCPGYFDALFTVSDVDALIGASLLREGDLRIAKDGILKPFAAFVNNGAVDRRQVLAEYEGGATIVFEHLNLHHDGLGQMLAECESELKIPIRANAYLTPARSKGFSRHYDTHDVLVMQVAGSKTWQIYSNPLPLPHEEQPFKAAWLDDAVKIADVTLEPGDVLYLPRGFIHGASSNHDTSLHITVGIRAMALREVAVALIKQAAVADPVLRASARFHGAQRHTSLAAARQHLHEMVDQLSLSARFDDVLYSFLKKRNPPLKGQLMARHAAMRIGPATRLRVRPGMLLHPFLHAGVVSLMVNGSKLKFPAAATASLCQMRGQQTFSALELPDPDLDASLSMLQQLYDAGALLLEHDRCAADANPHGQLPTTQEGVPA